MTGILLWRRCEALKITLVHCLADDSKLTRWKSLNLVPLTDSWLTCTHMKVMWSVKCILFLGPLFVLQAFCKWSNLQAYHGKSCLWGTIACSCASSVEWNPIFDHKMVSIYSFMHIQQISINRANKAKQFADKLPLISLQKAWSTFEKYSCTTIIRVFAW